MRYKPPRVLTLITHNTRVQKAQQAHWKSIAEGSQAAQGLAPADFHLGTRLLPRTKRYL